MSRIHLASTPSDALKGRSHVIVLGTRPAILSAPVQRALGAARAKPLAAMARQIEPAALGKTATTWPATGQAPRVTVGVLPESVSRHVSPSRAHAMAACLEKAEVGHAGTKGIVAVIDDPADYVAAACAVGRLMPLYTRKSRAPKSGDAWFAAVTSAGKPVPPPRGALAALDAARWAASMVDRPTADLTTADFVTEARALVKGLRGVRTEVLVGDELLRAGLGGVHAVGRAAMVPPRLLILEHAPKNASRTFALVGKGIVYDTGGLALKPRDAMLGMKGDMGGGAAVTGAFAALVREGFPHRLACLVPLAENAIGPDAYRNDDILTLHSGKTVEINNTDAEGRLLLADACSYAVKRFRPDVLVDAATLTGAQLVATGKKHAAIVSNREGLERAAVRAGRRSGDLVHPLPFAPELYQKEFKSEVADMTNSVKDRMNAQSSCAAQFVWSHVDDPSVAWLHVDLAGPASSGDRGTGFGVALLRDLLATLTPADLAD